MTGADRRSIAARDHRRPRPLSEGSAGDNKSEGVRPTPRFASIDPYGCAWILRCMRQGRVNSATVRGWVQQLREAGRTAEADAVAHAWAQLGASAAEVQGFRTSVDVSAEVDLGEVDQQSELLTTNQAAERLGCSAHWVRDLIRAGKLTGQRIGRTWLVDPLSVEEQMLMRRRSAA